MTVGWSLSKAITCTIQPNRRGTKRPPAALHASAVRNRRLGAEQRLPVARLAPPLPLAPGREAPVHVLVPPRHGQGNPLVERVERRAGGRRVHRSPARTSVPPGPSRYRSEVGRVGSNRRPAAHRPAPAREVVDGLFHTRQKLAKPIRLRDAHDAVASERVRICATSCAARIESAGLRGTQRCERHVWIHGHGSAHGFVSRVGGVLVGRVHGVDLGRVCPSLGATHGRDRDGDDHRRRGGSEFGHGGNLMINMFDIAVITARALDVPVGGSAAGRSHHRRLHGGPDVPRTR